MIQNQLKLFQQLKNAKLLNKFNSTAQLAFSTSRQVFQIHESAFQLCKYAALGNLDKIQQLVNLGHQVNSYDYDMRTPLHVAAAFGHKDIVQYLLDNGAESRQDKFGGLPINDAVRSNYQEIAQILINQPGKFEDCFQNSQNQQLMNQVLQIIVQEGLFSFSLIVKEIDYYFNQLGLDPFYFEVCKPKQIAKHIHALISAKEVADIQRNSENIQISLQEDENQSFYIFTQNNQSIMDNLIEQDIRSVKLTDAFELVSFTSTFPAISGGKQKLTIAIKFKSEFLHPQKTETQEFNEAYHKHFQRVANNPNKKYSTERYKLMFSKATNNPSPAFQQFVHQSTGDTIFMFGINQGRSINKSDSHLTWFSYIEELTKIFQNHKIEVHKKVVNPFSNGVVLYSFFCKFKPSQNQLDSIQSLSNLIFTMPQSPLTWNFLNGKITGQELLFLYSSIRFSYYFINKINPNYEQLFQNLESNPSMQRKLVTLQQKLATQKIKLEVVYKKIINEYDEIWRVLFNDFQKRLSGQKHDQNHIAADIPNLLKKVKNLDDRQLLETIYKFNQAIVKTNFYNTQKAAIGYRLDPKVFLSDTKLPEVPYGIFMFCSRDWQGFHVRFRDISRGGVRLIKSNKQNYILNRTTQFQETYNLAYTQKMKNKDIPESGSKGTILMFGDRNHCAKSAFNQYVDTMAELMLVKEGVTDLYKKPEFIFLGPDENTADLMDSAALHLKEKGYAQWKSFTTGKSISLGGIPHDKYGMTTLSVRAYVNGIREKLGLIEEQCTKFITGGPDGDLGSNEIKMGKEIVVGVVDGSGVLYDSNGIDREELLRLADLRLPVENFKGKLSDKGYLVKVSDNNIKLPNGQLVESGIHFRNTFHLHPDLTADFFVPCGGRPESVNLNNIEQMFKPNGSPKFKYIVEGANLFISNTARQILEERNTVLFKDASTNKGGVTSSSLEVLAALSMNDEQFKQHISPQPDGSTPEFYNTYVKEIQQRIHNNAYNEFLFIWNERKRTGKQSAILTNELSENMNNLFDIILESNLFENMSLRRKVLSKMVPQSLQNLIGLEQVMERVPEAYQRAQFATYISSSYYYKIGSNSNVYNFYEFMQTFNENTI